MRINSREHCRTHLALLRGMKKEMATQTKAIGTLVSVRSAARKGQRGNMMIESAFVIIPLLAILCAIIDFSMAIFMRNSLLNAVREGTRYAITGQTGAGACQDASIKSVVQQFSLGILNGAAGLAKININYYDPVTLADVTAAANSNGEGHVVRVSVAGVSWLWMLNGIWQNVDSVRHGSTAQTYTGVTIGAASSDIVEPPPGGVPPCR